MRAGAPIGPSIPKIRPATALWTSRAVTPGCASDPAAISLSERISVLRIADRIPPRPGASQAWAQSVATGPHGRGHPNQGTDAPLVVTQLAVPDPGGPAPLARPRHGVHMSFRNRPQEGRAVRHPERDHVVVPDGEEGRR